MVTLNICNVRTNIIGALHKDRVKCNDIHAALRVECSFLVPGAEWSPAYKSGAWDGLISLYEKRAQSFPTGLLPRILNILKQQGIEYKLVDSRIKAVRNLNITTRFGEYGRRLYDYQKMAAERAFKASRGIIAVGTGGGKTYITCQIIADIGAGPILVIVPSISLLKQTRDELAKNIAIDGKPAKIGMIGDGICEIEPDGINLCTYQTSLSAFNEKFVESRNKIEQDELVGESNRKTFEQLQEAYNKAKSVFNSVHKYSLQKQSVERDRLDKLKSDVSSQSKQHLDEIKKLETRLDKELSAMVKVQKSDYKKAEDALNTRILSRENKEKIRNLFKRAQTIMVDEAHIAAIVIEALCGHADRAYYKYGMSATPWREDNQEIRIEGCLGRKLVHIPPTYLIENNYLVPPKIFMVQINHIEDSDNYNDAYDKHIVHCWERNYRIKQFAEAFKEAGKPVMIICDRIKHGQILEAMIQDSIFVPGSDKGEDDPGDEEQDYRKRMLNACERNEKILIGTQWMNTGIDAPAITVLIMAGSIQSSSTVLQTIGRVLRLSPETGKTEAIIIDFMDNEKNMHKHSIARKRVYQSESAFVLKMIK